MIDPQRVVNDRYNNQCSRLIGDDAANRRKNLLEDIEDLDRVREHLGAETARLVGRTELQPLSKQVTAEQLLAGPAIIGDLVAEAYGHISPAYAVQNGLWIHATLINCEAGKLDLKELLLSPAKKNPKQEEQVRNLLRKGGGLFAVRKHVSVMEDCLLGRVYWRERWLAEAEEIHSLEKPEVEEMRQTFCRGAIWPPFLTIVLHRGTLGGGPVARSSLMRALTKWLAVDGNRMTDTVLRNHLKEVAAILAGIELEMMTPDKATDRIASAIRAS